MQGSLAMFSIWNNGSEEQREPVAAGHGGRRDHRLFGLTEPDAGSIPSSMKTRARRDGDDWVLNGRKMWITNGSIADVAVVWAGTDEGILGSSSPPTRPDSAPR